MSTLNVATVKSTTTSPPTFQNSNGTEIGTLCRAWVNFNGTGTVAIRQQYNVSSITDNGTGDYTVNFTTSMVDANYSVVGSARLNSSSYKRIWTIKDAGPTTTSVRGQTGHSSVTSIENEDCDIVAVAVFR
jgi:hypothetical protein